MKATTSNTVAARGEHGHGTVHGLALDFPDHSSTLFELVSI
jgi:hypothetical protein